MWAGVPEAVSAIIFFVLMCFVGMMEGLQIALFAVVNMSAEELESKSSIAFKNYQLTFRGENLQVFLIGRQICVTICMFVIARITTLAVKVGEHPNIFGVSDGVQTFFNTGLLGALITTIVASLAWRVIASSFPIAFLSNPLVYIIIRICLLLEASGICSSAWVLARYHKPIVNYQPDSVHLEGEEPHNAEPVTARDREIDRFSSVLKYTFSLVVLLFSIILLSASIFSSKSKFTEALGLRPAAVFVFSWC
jgi:Silicon transporter